MVTAPKIKVTDTSPSLQMQSLFSQNQFKDISSRDL